MKKNLLDVLGKEILFFDGAMGTELQKRGLEPGEIPELWNITRPEIIRDVHLSYLQAGADLLKTCTFGAHGLKLQGSGYTVDKVVTAAVKLAKETAEPFGALVCLDVGPLGKLLRPYGDLDFEDAVKLFGEIVIAGAGAGADAVLIETMSDTYEMKAAILAARENCDLPVLATYTFDRSGRMLNGADPETAARLAEALGCAAVGFNCGLGPEQVAELLPRMTEAVHIPIVVNPNAGLPVERNGVTCYDVQPVEFAAWSRKLVEAGVVALGGCCGTTPEHIAVLVKECRGLPLAERKVAEQCFCTSYDRTIVLGREPKIIGERLNPTGKKVLQEALRNGDTDYLCRLALEQVRSGAHILDLNVGTPGVSEKELLPRAVEGIQGILGIPLQIDTADGVAAEAALRRYNGIPILNSVNGSEESMARILPLVKKYGAMVVALTLDEGGIPVDVKGRLAIAGRIIDRAERMGIPRQHIIVDPLALTIGAGSNNAVVALDTLQALHEQGVATVLGVSNISFGLPSRDEVNSTFFAMALQRGLSLGIINPQSRNMLGVYYAYKGLAGLDENLQELLQIFGGKKEATGPNVQPQMGVYEAILGGLVETARAATEKELSQREPLDIINNSLIPALNKVGEDFEKKKAFLPQLLMSADAAKGVFDVIKTKVGTGKSDGPVIVLATVEGDIHDIGKNIVKVILENYGYKIVDLGKDVPVETVVHAAREQQAFVVGLSALMTTTVKAMVKTIQALKSAGVKSKILVGGAVLTEEYAAKIGADGYAANAVEAVKFAKSQKN